MEEKTPSNTLPWPIAEIVPRCEQAFGSKWFNDLSPFLAKLLEWSLFFAIGYWGWGYGWILFLATIHFLKYTKGRTTSTDTLLARLSALSSEEDVLGDRLAHYPAWVAFPDYDRPEWLNSIIKQMWPQISGYATEFVVTFIEPEIQRILDQLRLESVSRFQVKKVDLAKIPVRLGGIKVYEKQSSPEEIVLDAEVIYSGDARVLFSLQGVQAEIKHIHFKGLARITLKPLFSSFPFIGGFDFCFLDTPKLEYSLGGIGTFGDLPGAYSLIRTIVRDQIRHRFVWPKKFHLYLPIDAVSKASDRRHLLNKPGGVLSACIREARNLEKKDSSLTGSGKSDPYVIVRVGDTEYNYREQYVRKSLNPEWNYEAEFILDSPSGHKLDLEVFDHDKSSDDDFLGKVRLDLESVAERDHDDPLDTWLNLKAVKHGEVHLICQWKCTEPLDDQDPELFQSYVVSVLVERCEHLNKAGVKSALYPKVYLTHTQGRQYETQIQNKTDNPTYNESYSFLVKNFDTESISIHVRNAKSAKSLGKTKVPLKFLAKSKRSEFYAMPWPLEEALDPNATVVISAKLFAVTNNL